MGPGISQNGQSDSDRSFTCETWQRDGWGLLVLPEVGHEANDGCWLAEAASGSSQFRRWGTAWAVLGTGLSIRGAPKCTSLSSWPQNQEFSGSACLATFQSACLIRLLISGGWEEGSDYRQSHVPSKFCHLKKICSFTEHLRHIFFFVVPK